MSYIITTFAPGFIEPVEVEELPVAIERFVDEVNVSVNVSGVDEIEVDKVHVISELETYGEYTLTVDGWKHEIRRVRA